MGRNRLTLSSDLLKGGEIILQPRPNVDSYDPLVSFELRQSNISAEIYRIGPHGASS